MKTTLGWLASKVNENRARWAKANFIKKNGIADPIIGQLENRWMEEKLFATDSYSYRKKCNWLLQTLLAKKAILNPKKKPY